MSVITVGCVANVYNEASALPGWVEHALQLADWVGVMHAGPGGERSNDGTIEILEKWRVPTEYCAIDDGFGTVRTRTLRMCPPSIDYVVLLDADERLYPVHRVMYVAGDPTPQDEVDAILRNYDVRTPGAIIDWDAVGRLGSGLVVTRDDITPYDQSAWLREVLRAEKPDALATVRRHWHDFSFRRPTQSWVIEPDWQMRVVRNDPTIYFDPGTRMHERLVGVGKVARSDMMRGPFFDHFHLHFKRMEQSQRAHDVAIYDAVHEGRRPPTWAEFFARWEG